MTGPEARLAQVERRLMDAQRLLESLVQLVIQAQQQLRGLRSNAG